MHYIQTLDIFAFAFTDKRTGLSAPVDGCSVADRS